ncbi:50S ribosomal protein L21e [Candidatus Woesearchaeota archaeon CG10_big_fil_rev_8_21_14_0_10_34_8]|nr:MAG: 50S ribosomal protein L21e [Candidatus Woesearchaeota archaeon CG10_big_fil_rev_8_21_14_0_10_34_8]
MSNRKGGSRHKTRKTFKKNIKERGKISLTRYFQKLEEGQQVVLKSEPAVQKGMYHGRFHGYSGKIIGKQGRCYKVAISDQGKIKEVIIHPIHLKKI